MRERGRETDRDSRVGERERDRETDRDSRESDRERQTYR